MYCGLVRLSGFGLGRFDEDNLYAALDELCRRQPAIEQALYRHYLKRCGAPSTLFLYDVTSSYLEGHHNAQGDYGYNRDGKRGKLQIALGLPADREGEPLAANEPRGPRATAMRERLRDEEEQKKYRKRAGMVEPVFGITKEQKRFRRFLMRGIDKVQAEWMFLCATFNLWRMFRRGYEPQMA